MTEHDQMAGDAEAAARQSALRLRVEQLRRKAREAEQELGEAEQELAGLTGAPPPGPPASPRLFTRVEAACLEIFGHLEGLSGLESLLSVLLAAAAELLPGATAYAVYDPPEGSDEPALFACHDAAGSYCAREDLSGGLLACCGAALGDRRSGRWQRAGTGALPPLELVAAAGAPSPGGARGLLVASRAESFSDSEEVVLAQLAFLASLALTHQEALGAVAECELVIQQHQEELQALLQALTDAVLMLDANGDITAANPAAVVALGGEPIGTSWTELALKTQVCYPDGEPVPLEQLPSRRALRGETLIHATYMYPQGGRWAYGEVSAAPLGDPENPSGAVLLMRDVTADHDLHEERTALIQRLQQSQEQLAQSERVYRAIEALIPYGMWVSDLPSRTTYVSPAFSALIGVDAIRLGFDEQLALCAPEDAPRVREAWRQASASSTDVTLEVRILGADGQYHWVLHRGVPICNAQGQAEVWVGVNLAIDEIKAAQQDREGLLLREQHERALLEAVITQMPGSTLIVDPGSNMLFVNDRIVGIQGRARHGEVAPITGHRHHAETLDGQPLGEDDLAITQALRHGRVTQDRRLRIRCQDQDYIISTYAQPVYDEAGQVIAAVSTWFDITEQVQAEEELRRHRDRLEELVQERTAQLQSSNEDLRRQEGALRELTHQLIQAEQRERESLAFALHDTVTQSIAFAHLQGQLLAEATAEAETREGLQEIVEMLRRAVAQARALLYELSPPVARGMRLQQALQELGSKMSEEYHYAVACTAEGELPLLDYDLKVVLYRSVRELLINAAKHAGATQVTIATRVGDTWGEIVVADNGCGMPPGTGEAPGAVSFGLLSIRERLRCLGGALQADSRPGEGSTVRLRFPLTAAPGTGLSPGAGG